MKTIRPSIPLVAVCALLVSSCSTHYHGGLEPVSPKPTKSFSGGLATVDSLQPTLSWKNKGAENAKYDIIIYTGVAKSAGTVFHGLADAGYYHVPGVKVYHREGIDGCSHRVEQPLEPNTVYVWAVRTRTGEHVGPWCTYDFKRGEKAIVDLHGVPGQSGHNLWWSFQTPKR